MFGSFCPAPGRLSFSPTRETGPPEPKRWYDLRKHKAVSDLGGEPVSSAGSL